MASANQGLSHHVASGRAAFARRSGARYRLSAPSGVNDAPPHDPWRARRVRDGPPHGLRDSPQTSSKGAPPASGAAGSTDRSLDQFIDTTVDPRVDFVGYSVGRWLKAHLIPTSERAFNDRASGIIRRFDDYVAVDSLHVNGRATEGANSADLGGITLAWDAFTKI
jgi:hypothetical protein